MRRLLRWFSLKSLLSKYLLIVLIALGLLPLTLLSTTLLLYSLTGGQNPENPYEYRALLEEQWHDEAARLGDAPSAAEIDAAVRAFLTEHGQAGAFWVDAGGRTHLAALSLDAAALPVVWAPSDVVRFKIGRAHV